MKPANAKELLSQPDIDGALVGGASLEPAASRKSLRPVSSSHSEEAAPSGASIAAGMLPADMEEMLRAAGAHGICPKRRS